MGMKTLVVGQKVDIASGCYVTEGGTAVDITPESVSVQVVRNGRIWGTIRFDNEGMSCDGSGTFKCGPWFITDICPHVLDSDGYHCRRCWYPMVP
jgi:hypothetical protein